MKKIIEKYYDLILSLLIITLPFSKAFPNIILFIIGLFFLTNLRTIDFYKIKKHHYIFCVIILSVIIKLLLFSKIKDDFSLLSRLFIACLIPFLFLKVENIEIIKKAFITSTFLLIVVSLISFYNYYKIYHNLPFSNGHQVNNIMVLERPYVGFFATIGLIFSVEQIQSKKNQFVFISASLLIFAFILLISARNSILTIAFLFLLYLGFYLKIGLEKKFKYLLVFFISIFFIFQLNQNIKNRFFLQANFTKTLAEIKLMEPRFIIWPCALETFKDNGFNKLFGNRSQLEITENMKNCYQTAIINNDSKRDWFILEKFNTHNQFLGFLLLSGIIGLSLLVLYFIFSLKDIKNDFFGVAIYTSIIFFFLFENVLYRQLGCYLFGLLTSIYLIKKSGHEKN